MAQVASLCTELQRAYQERRTADEAWLAEAAPSAFGARFVELLRNFFTQPVGEHYEHRRQKFDLVGRKVWPGTKTLVSTARFELETMVPSWYSGSRRRSTWFTYAPYDPFCWSPISPRRRTLKDPNNFDSGVASLEIFHDDGVVVGSFGAESATELVSYLSLFYLAYNRLAQQPRGGPGWPISPDPNAQPLRRDFPTDVQRALDVLRVRNIRVGTAIRS
jgi:hypothetical protein